MKKKNTNFEIKQNRSYIGKNYQELKMYSTFLYYILSYIKKNFKIKN